MTVVDRPERLLRIDEVHRCVGLSTSMIYKLIPQGKFPSLFTITPFASRWERKRR